MMYAFGLWLGMMAVLLDASLGNPEEESQAAPATAKTKVSPTVIMVTTMGVGSVAALLVG